MRRLWLHRILFTVSVGASLAGSLAFATKVTTFFSAPQPVVLVGEDMHGCTESSVFDCRELVWRAWYKNDQETLRMILPDELIAIDPGQDNWHSRSQVLAAAGDFAARRGILKSLKFPKTEVQTIGQAVILYSLYDVTFELNGNTSHISGRATEIFVRRAHKWVNVGWHLDSGR